MGFMVLTILRNGIYVLTFLCAFLLSAQSKSELSFPKDYFGNYKGLLEIDTPVGIREIPMELWLQPTDTVGKYRYVIVYGEGEKRQERKYHLVVKNENLGDYVIDENNGILLEAKVFENRLYSLFEVSGNLLTTFITFDKDQLLFEITVASREKALETKENEEGTEVVSYPVVTRQRALLHKY